MLQTHGVVLVELLKTCILLKDTMEVDQQESLWRKQFPLFQMERMMLWLLLMHVTPMALVVTLLRQTTHFLLTIHLKQLQLLTIAKLINCH